MKTLNASSTLAVAPQFAAIRAVFPPDGDYQRQRWKRSTGNVFTAINPAQTTHRVSARTPIHIP